MMKMRLDAMQTEMKRQGIDCLFVSPSSDLYYLTGYHGMAMERPTFLILTHEAAYLVLPHFEASNVDIKIRDYVTCVPWAETENAYEKAKCILGDSSMHVAINNTAPSVMFYNLRETFSDFQWTIAGPLTAKIRRVKSPAEIALLSEAQHRAGKALMRLLEQGICGMREREAGETLRQHCIEEGMDALGIGIVGSGINSAYPHHHTGDKIIGFGDVVLIDFGAGYNGYQSDMTRTVAVGSLPEGFDEIYNIVLRANQAAFQAICPGISCGDIDSAARDVIKTAGYDVYFTHRLGHGIGLDVHEDPYVVSGNQQKLEEGNVFSVEPGIYIENRFGIRIEDIVAVTGDGAIRLTDVPHDIMVID